MYNIQTIIAILLNDKEDYWLVMFLVVLIQYRAICNGTNNWKKNPQTFPHS